MSPDRKHLLGAILLWGGVVIAMAGVALIQLKLPWLGLFCLPVALLIGGCGARLKRKYCPRCREGACKAEKH